MIFNHTYTHAYVCVYIRKEKEKKIYFFLHNKQRNNCFMKHQCWPVCINLWSYLPHWEKYINNPVTCQKHPCWTLTTVHRRHRVLTYLDEGTEEGADGAVGRESCHRSVEDFLCQEVGRVILPQMLLLLHVALQRHRWWQLCVKEIKQRFKNAAHPPSEADN